MPDPPTDQTPSARLTVVPSAASAKRSLDRLTADGGVCLGEPVIALGRLGRMWLDRAPCGPPLSPAVALRLVRQAAEAGGLAPAAAKPGLVADLAGIFNRLTSADPDYRTTTDRLAKLDSPRLRAIGRSFGVYRRQLADLGLDDRAGLAWQAVAQAERAPLPQAMAGVGRVIIEAVEEFSPPQLALLRKLVGRGVGVEVRLPFQPGRPGYGDNEAGFQAFERLGPAEDAPDLLPIELADRAADGLAELIIALAEPGQGTAQPGPGLERLIAPGVYAEAETIGRRVRDRLDQGEAADQIAIVARDLTGLTGQMIEDVGRRYGLPLDFRRGRPVAQSGPVEAILAGLRGAVEGYDRNLLIRLAESAYLAPRPDPGPGERGRLIRSAGLWPSLDRDWRNLIAAQVGRSNGEQAERDRAALGELNRIIDRFRPFARPLTLARAADRLAELAEGLNLAEAGSPLARSDRAALDVLVEAVGQTARDWDRAGPADQTLAPGDLVGLITDSLQGRNLNPGGRDRDGVKVLRLEDVRGSRFRRLYLMGLTESIWPPRPRPDILINDGHKISLNRALGGRVFATSQDHYRRERLLFMQALASAEEGVVISRSLTDGGGRPAAPSSHWLWVSDALSPGAAPEVTVDLQSPPPLNQALSEGELISRISLDLWARGDEPGPARATVRELCDRPGWSERLADVADRARAEQAREAYLLNPDRASARANVYTGRLSAETARQVAAGLTKSGRLRLSVSNLDGLAVCPFRVLADRVWQARPEEEPGPEPTPLDVGDLAHRLLEALGQRLKQGDDPVALAERLDGIMEPISQAWLDQAVRGHPALAQRAADEVKTWGLAFLDWEGQNVDSACRPWRLEEPLPSWRLKIDQATELEVKTRADRIDRCPDGLRIIDYKTGRQPKREFDRQIAEAAQARFQLPIYLAALAGEMTDQPLEAAFLLVRTMELSRELAYGPDLAQRLHDRVAELVGLALAGRFDLEPTEPGDCNRQCGLGQICRYRPPLGRIEAEEGAD